MNGVEVKLADREAAIGDHAFYDCWSLTNLTIPISVTSIR
jgi:hypothetical protein